VVGGSASGYAEGEKWMNGSRDTVLDRVRVHEVAGVFRSRDALDAAVGALLLAGFDRADIDLMAGFDTVREKPGGVMRSTSRSVWKICH
jgi:hypothetical protein